MPKCKFCQQEPHAEVTSGRHFIICRSPTDCGSPDGKGFRPLSNGQPTEAAAWKQARDENKVKD